MGKFTYDPYFDFDIKDVSRLLVKIISQLDILIEQKKKPAAEDSEDSKCQQE